MGAKISQEGKAIREAIRRMWANGIVNNISTEAVILSVKKYTGLNVTKSQIHKVKSCPSFHLEWKNKKEEMQAPKKVNRREQAMLESRNDQEAQIAVAQVKGETIQVTMTRKEAWAVIRAVEYFLAEGKVLVDETDRGPSSWAAGRMFALLLNSKKENPDV